MLFKKKHWQKHLKKSVFLITLMLFKKKHWQKHLKKSIGKNI
jgi:hypothetical protein